MSYCMYVCTNMHIYITQNRMNRTLLIANYNEARTFMFNKCPSDYGVAFTKEGHRAHRDHRCYSEKKQPRVVYLQASSDESLRFFIYMYTYIRMYYFYIICTYLNLFSSNIHSLRIHSTYICTYVELVVCWIWRI